MIPGFTYTHWLCGEDGFFDTREDAEMCLHNHPVRFGILNGLLAAFVSLFIMLFVIMIVPDGFKGHAMFIGIVGAFILGYRMKWIGPVLQYRQDQYEVRGYMQHPLLYDKLQKNNFISENQKQMAENDYIQAKGMVIANRALRSINNKRYDRTPTIHL